MGSGRIFKGDEWNCMGLENLTHASSLFSTQDVISCARDTEASSACIFQQGIHTYEQL